jgi:predicted O-methyltransferase YrrM
MAKLTTATRRATRRSIGVAVLVPCLLVAVGPAGAQSPADSSTQHYKRDYRFTADWFTHSIPVWKKVLAPYAGKPGVSYLEVGVFQGRSALWVLENVLTDSSARMTVIDIMINDAYLENVAKSGFAEKVTTLEGRSQDLLRTLAPASFDIIYIDGSHRGDDVLADAVLAFPLLEDGGTLIFDDYLWADGDWPEELTPKVAIDTFVTLNRHRLDVVLRGDQLVLKKRPSVCAAVGDSYCSRLGRYAYHWKRRVLFDPVRRRDVELSDAERAVVERLIRDIEMGQSTVSIPPELKSDPAYQSLDAKLK